MYSTDRGAEPAGRGDREVIAAPWRRARGASVVAERDGDDARRSVVVRAVVARSREAIAARLKPGADGVALEGSR